MKNPVSPAVLNVYPKFELALTGAPEDARTPPTTCSVEAGVEVPSPTAFIGDVTIDMKLLLMATPLGYAFVGLMSN